MNLKTAAVFAILCSSIGVAQADPKGPFSVGSELKASNTVFETVTLTGLLPSHIYDYTFEFWYNAVAGQSWSAGRVGFQVGTTTYWSTLITRNSVNAADAASFMPSGTPLMQVVSDALGNAVVVIGATVFAQNTDDTKFNKNAGRTIVFGPVTVSKPIPNPTPVPGPIAGAGLPVLLGLAGYAAWRRRKGRAVA